MFKEWFAAATVGMMTMFGASSTMPGGKPPMKDMKGRPTTTREMKGAKEVMGSANVDIACISAAVITREGSLAGAVTSFNSNVSAAYTARASALANAYALTDAAAVKAAVKTAWTQHQAAMRVANKAWKSSKEGAWNTFKTSIKSCGTGAAAVADTGNASGEMSGL